jgi:hypothetical protein
MGFQKHQLLIHETRGECVALHEWNSRETVCLVTATCSRHVLMNCLMRPVFAGGVPGNRANFICIIDRDGTTI